MLLTKEVEISLGMRNVKHYESLGYIIPKTINKYGNLVLIKDAKIKVKVEDLSSGSAVKVNVKCDNPDCKNPYLKPIEWFNYIKNVKGDGKYYCRSCAIKIYGLKKSKKTKLKNSKSFEQWCIENNRQDVLDRWDYELNNCKPSEITYGTNKKYYFKCPRGLHESELKGINNFIHRQKNGLDCKQCNSFAQWGIDNICKDFLEKYWDWEKNTVSPWSIPKAWNNKVWIKCQEKDYHGSYETTCANFYVGNRCSYCYNSKVHILDSLGTLYPKSFEVWSNKNKKSPYEYFPFSDERVYYKCINNKHDDYLRAIKDGTKFNFECPFCNREREESFLQEKVRLYLESLNYTILHENNCTIVPKNPKTHRNMPFDNEVKELKLIIEVHGKQHYEEVSGSWFDKGFSLHYRKLKDRYKRMYAKYKGYYYLEIPYWTDDKEETWKKLIDNKINEILNN